MPPSASSAATRRAAAGPTVEVSTTWVVRPSPLATIACATCSDAEPSGRLSTTTSARRATAATSGATAAPAGGRRAGSAASWAITS